MPASLPASDCTECTTEGAAELSRVAGGMSGTSWLEGPVIGDKLIEDSLPLSPETVSDILSGRGCKEGLKGVLEGRP